MTDGGMPGERRQYKRLKLKEGVFAVRKASGWQLVNVLDLNQKGMGITLSTDGSLLGQYDFFDLFSCHVEGVLKHLPGIIVSHQAAAAPGSACASAMTRCGVKFLDIPPSAQGFLEVFINQHALESV